MATVGPATLFSYICHGYLLDVKKSKNRLKNIAKSLWKVIFGQLTCFSMSELDLAGN